MSVFTEALNRLKADMEAIAGETFSYETAKLGRDDAKQVFADLRLLPESLHSEATDFVSPAKSDYSDNVLQAIWNIADLTTKIAEGRSSLPSQLMAFRKSFGYLDKKTWVPKIIDDKTYQAGLAMQRFLVVGVNDPEAREKGLTNLLQGLQKELEKRLMIYEAHTPEAIAKATTYQKEEVQFREQARQQTAAWHVQYDQFQQLIGEESIQDLLRPGKELLESGSNDVSAIDAMIADRRRVLAQLKEQITLFRQFNTVWKKELDRHFPNIISHYHRLLANPETATIHEIITAWQNLFNTGIDVTQNTIKSELDTLHDEGIAACTNETRITELFETQIAKLTEARELAVYKQQLRAAITMEDIAVPDFITGEGETLAYTVRPASATDDLTRLTENSEAYVALIAALRQYSARLTDQQRALEHRDDQLNLDLPPPPPHAEKEAFKLALEKTHVDLLAKITAIRTQRDHVQRLITTALREHQTIEEARSKHTREGREQLLHATKEKEEEAFKIAKASAIKLAEKKAALASMTEPEGIEEALDQLRHHEAARREALRIADETLARFAQAIENRSSLYIPAKDVPQEELKRYLECSETIGQFIDELYEHERQAGAWYGFNTTYVRDWWDHHTSILESDFDVDLEVLVNYIQTKREQIATELAIDITQPPALAPVSQSPSEVTLYKLQQRYQEIIEPRKARERQAQELHHLEIQTHLHDFAHAHAKFEHRMLKLELKLRDAQAREGEVRLLLDGLEGLSANEALAAIRRHETAISRMQNLLTTSTFADRSCEEQVRQITRKLAAHDSAWTSLNERILNVETLTPEQTEQKETLDAQLQQLKERNGQLSQQYNALNRLLTEVIRKKEALQLQRLAEMAASMQDLATQADNLALLATPEKQRLQEAIHKQLQTLAVVDASLLTDVSGSKKPAIAEQLEAIERLKPRLSSAEKTLQQATGVSGVYDDEDLETVRRVRHDRLTALKTKFFGSRDDQLSGIFGDYLKERAHTFSWRDFFSSAAALFLRCFSYQTEAEKRQNYLEQLNSAVAEYQQNPARYNALQTVIGEGLQRFKPRANEDHPDYQKSLHAKLSAFKQELAETLTVRPTQLEAPRSTLF
ncbi:hypothetical protein [Legionella oakridgensis]|uniref:hypothetical protein n=1 Tax=Legionella oakridgensis TaxID=29423 RepID=UPI0003DE7250|nr:hypothetical protein [Legionella oakridgensis]ETO93725.1 hypothetical protein LOR_62c15670 [Legionella oakridgensis RV-2-2007]